MQKKKKERKVTLKTFRVSTEKPAMGDWYSLLMGAKEIKPHSPSG